VDASLLRAINGLRRPWLDAIAAVISGPYGFWSVPLALLVALAIGRRRAAPAVRDGLLAWFLAVAVAEEIIKPIVRRPRPTAVPALRRTLHVLGQVPRPSSLSFPSGTAAAFFAGATWIWLKWGPRAGIPALVIATVAGAARVYAGVHYPTDVLGGAAIGVAVAWGVDRFSTWASREG
jgi:undecaprenyl-diphosphatase